MLNLKNISVGYDGLKVLFDVSMNIQQGEVVALVGSNGAGKTTLLRAVSGLIPLTDGQITWLGKDITRMPDYKRPELGIAHIPQGRGILSSITIHKRTWRLVSSDMRGMVPSAPLTKSRLPFFNRTCVCFFLLSVLYLD